MRASVYIDGFNLYYGAVKNRWPDCKWLDLGALSARVLPKDQINQIRYFTATVTPRMPDGKQPARQQAYLRALETIPHLTTHYGQFRTHPTRMAIAKPKALGPKTALVLKTEEKGSDVNLASFLLLDGFQEKYEVALVISNDSDLAEPIRMVQRELGKKVGVVNPHPPNKRSRDLKPTFFKQLRQGAVRACQFPETLTDAQGTIHKPEAWRTP